ncbi:hypothetical protein Leryth_024236 [Lithospermum erythrorhizon]|nr:hypothetical protein Leryth_024236 [Lithospermum erythrorhizon]
MVFDVTSAIIKVNKNTKNFRKKGCHIMTSYATYMGTLRPQENMPIHRQGFHLMKKKRDRATQTSIRRRTEYNDDDGDSDDNSQKGEK